MGIPRARHGAGRQDFIHMEEMPRGSSPGKKQGENNVCPQSGMHKDVYAHIV